MIVAGGHRITKDTIKKLKKKGMLTVLWTIDAPVNFKPILETSIYYDHIFCQGTEAINLLKQNGIKSAHWLPMACSPQHHYPVQTTSNLKKKYVRDIVFVGSNYPVRQLLFEKLAELDFSIWGPGWEKIPDSSPLRKCIKGGMLKLEEWLEIYSASKVILAPHYQGFDVKLPVYQASPRVFEALACKAFIMVDRQPDVLSIFKEEEHLVCYDSVDDLREKIKYYIEHPVERERIAQNGYEFVIKNHTYIDRINELLRTINDRTGEK
mgnify:CR=1 FL=1